MVKLLFLGLEGAGHKTALQVMAEGKVNQGHSYIPQVITEPEDFQETNSPYRADVIHLAEGVENAKLSGGVEVFAMDTTAPLGLRPFWRTYSNGLDAVVFFVDSSNRLTMGAAGASLKEVFEETSSVTPVLVFCNTGGASPEDVSNAFKLEAEAKDPTKGTRWIKAVGCTASSGEGLREGMEALVAAIPKRR